MELEQQLKRIEQLGKNKRTSFLLDTACAISGLDKLSEGLLEKHETKNPTINDKLYDYREDLVDEYGKFTDKLFTYITEEIALFCGFHKGNLAVFDCLFSYSDGNITFDEMIEELKQLAIDWCDVPEGYVMIKVKV